MCEERRHETCCWETKAASKVVLVVPARHTMAIIVVGYHVTKASLVCAKAHFSHFLHTQVGIKFRGTCRSPLGGGKEITECLLLVTSTSRNLLSVSHHLPRGASMDHKPDMWVIVSTAK